MISIEKAQEVVLANLPACKSERIGIREAQGRYLAEDLVAAGDIPPFRRALMDGYAVRALDVAGAPARLTIVGEVRAGAEIRCRVGPGQAAAVTTGAPVPEGADAVQIVEQTERPPDGGAVVVLKPVTPGENIAAVGSEAVAGETVLEAGRCIGPAELAVMAMFGYARVSAWKRPSVALLVTGDELVEASDNPGMHQIRNSNAYSLSGQLRLLGLEPEYLGIVRDCKADLRARVEDGLERDVLILTGGVSMGRYDFVKEVLQELQVQILFDKVAMKPGKPTVFARKGDRLLFGLPGNPVSTFVAFENFVRPALGRLCGSPNPELPRVRGALQSDMKQSPGRTAFLPARASWTEAGWMVHPLTWRGSADIIGFSRANAMVMIPGDRAFVNRGEAVEALLLPDFFHR